MSQMLKSSGAMAVATLVSRILGFIREAVYAAFMGVGPIASAFILAFQIPNLFRRLLGEGALSAAFIPLFKEKEKNSGQAEMWRAANAVISGLVIASVVIIVVVIAGVSVFLLFAQAGESADGVTHVHHFWQPHIDANTALMFRLLRIMFPYMLLVCLAAIFIGMLNARGHFFVPAMGTTILNVVMIGSVFAIAPLFGKTLDQRIYGLAVGVLVAGFAQALYQLWALKKDGFHYQWVSPWKDQNVREVVRKMIPGTMGVAAFQINVLLTNTMAYQMDQSIVAIFGYAVRLMELPQGIFGVSVATYMLPTLSAIAVDKNYPLFRSTLRQGISYLFFVNLLASIILVVLAEPIIRLLFERGKFDSIATHEVAIALQFLAPGLIVYSMVNVLARSFYALNDYKTPMHISLFCLGVNLLLALIFLPLIRQAGLGLANTLSSLCNVCFLLYALRIKLKKLELRAMRKESLPLLPAAIVAGVAAWGLYRISDRFLGHGNLWTKLVQVFGPILVASVLYYGLAVLAKVPAAHEVLNLFKEKLARKLGKSKVTVA